MVAYYKSVLEQDTSPVVICDLQHTILYMNPVAIAHYGRYGGEALLGRCLLDCHRPQSQKRILEVIAWFAADPTHNRIHTCYDEKQNLDLYMVALRNQQGQLIGYYEQQISRNRDISAFYCYE